MSEKSHWGNLLTGIGAMGAAFAAVVGVFSTKDSINNYFSNKNVNTNTQIMVVNTCEAAKQADLLIQAVAKAKTVDDAQDFDTFMADIPKEAKPNNKPIGLVIDPAYRSALKTELINATTDEAKTRIIQGYWEKTIQNKTKTDVKLNFDK